MTYKNNIIINNDALIDAAAYGEIEKVRLLLDKAPDINYLGSRGWNALVIAAHNGYTEIVAELLNRGADVNAKNKNGSTALMLAAQNGHTEIVNLLLSRDSDIDAKDNYRGTALTLAAVNGDTEICKLLIERGADIHAIDECGYNALMWAAYRRHIETVALLVDKGAYYIPKNTDGKSAITYAITYVIENENRDSVLYTIDKEINYNNYKRHEIARTLGKLGIVDIFQQKKPETEKAVMVIEDDNEPLHSSSLHEPLKRKYSQITASSSNENLHNDLMLDSSNIEHETAEALLNLKQI